MLSCSNDYALAKSIVQSGLTDVEWKKLGISQLWPNENPVLLWKRYRKYSLDRLIVMMNTYVSRSGVESKDEFAAVQEIVETGMSDEEWDEMRMKQLWPEGKAESWKKYHKYSLDQLVGMMDRWCEESNVGETQPVKRARLHNSRVECVVRYLASGKLENDCIRFDQSCTLPAEYGQKFPGHNIIFVRHACWHFLWIFEHIIQGITGAGMIVVGPPGCGKTWCSQFFLWYYFTVAKRTVVFESVAAKTVWVFKPEGGSYLTDYPATQRSVVELNSNQTIYLHDSGAGCTDSAVECAAKKVVWSSANGSSHRQASRLLLAYCFPTHTKDELRRACQLFGRPDVDVDWYFSFSGGSLRNALWLEKDAVLKRLSKAAARVNVDNIIDIVRGEMSAGVAYGPDSPTDLFTTQVRSEHLASLPQAEEGKEYSTCRPSGTHELCALREAYHEYNMQWLLCTEHVFSLVRRNATDRIETFNQRFLQITRDNPELGGDER